MSHSPVGRPPVRAGAFLISAIVVLIAHVAHAAIVAVDTRAGTAPPTRNSGSPTTATRTPAGYPLDVKFFAARAEPDLPLDKAIPRLFGEQLPGLGGPQGTGVQEGTAVGNLMTHPSLYVRSDGLDDGELVPPEWARAIDKRLAVVDKLLGSVGRLQLYHAHNIGVTAESKIIGTGFLVTADKVVTAGHVVREFCQTRKPGYPFKQDYRGANQALVKINFSGTRDDTPALCRVKSVLYVAPEGPHGERPARDFALLEIEEPQPERTPLPLQTIVPDDRSPGRRLMVCGYPTTNCPLDRLQTIGVKRLSLGNLLTEGKWNQELRLYHNCLTGGGSSGSPLVDWDAGTVWGVHFHWDGSQNLAEPIWEICKIDEVKQLLGSVATDAPQIEDPLDEPHESVIAQSSRPVLFVCDDDIHQGQIFPKAWVMQGADAHRRLRTVMRSVGRLSYQTRPDSRGDSSLVQMATGFVIADRLVVVPQFTQHPGGFGDPIFIEFNRTACLSSPVTAVPAQRFRLNRIVRPRPDGPPPLWHVYRINEGGAEPPPPLSLYTKKPGGEVVQKQVAVVGHAAQDYRIPEEVFVRVFPPPYGVKRIAFGRTIDLAFDQGEPLLMHDCSTSPGDAGAPLVDLTTGEVLGMHFGGAYLQANQAVPMSVLLAAPELQGIPELDALRQDPR